MNCVNFRNLLNSWVLDLTPFSTSAVILGQWLNLSVPQLLPLPLAHTAVSVLKSFVSLMVEACQSKNKPGLPFRGGGTQRSHCWELQEWF